MSKFRNSKSKSLQKLKQKDNDVSHVVKQTLFLQDTMLKRKVSKRYEKQRQVVPLAWLQALVETRRQLQLYLWLRRLKTSFLAKSKQFPT